MNTTTLMHTNQLMAIIDQERENQLEEMFTAQHMHANKFADQPQQIDVPQYVQTEQFDGPPPPYTAAGESDIEKNNQQYPKTISNDKLLQDLQNTSKMLAQQPPLMMELFMGNTLATKLYKRREKKRMERLEEVHDAWLRLGLDTRAIMQNGHQPLPPHFWNPPMYDAEEMNRRLAKFF